MAKSALHSYAFKSVALHINNNSALNVCAQMMSHHYIENFNQTNNKTQSCFVAYNVYVIIRFEQMIYMLFHRWA